MPYKDPAKKTEYSRNYYRNNKKKITSKSREKYAKNPRRFKSSTIKYKYGITYDDYERILAEQGNCCAICGATKSGGRGRFHIDHNHACCPGEKTCGKCLRGILCSVCNTKLATLESEWKELAEKYLKLWHNKNC